MLTIRHTALLRLIMDITLNADGLKEFCPMFLVCWTNHSSSKTSDKENIQLRGRSISLKNKQTKSLYHSPFVLTRNEATRVTTPYTRFSISSRPQSHTVLCNGMGRFHQKYCFRKKMYTVLSSCSFKSATDAFKAIVDIFNCKYTQIHFRVNIKNSL